jgi:hypothetical protein
LTYYCADSTKWFSLLQLTSPCPKETVSTSNSLDENHQGAYRGTGFPLPVKPPATLLIGQLYGYVGITPLAVRHYSC